MICLDTKCGKITGLQTDFCNIFLGVPYATCKRFEYSKPVTFWDNTFDATKKGNSCPQKRTYNPHLEHPRRQFFYREFRDGDTFTYDENCLNLNIYSPKTPGKYPVIVYIHGGGFDSGSNNESTFDGTEIARRGVIVVYINYRVGILGYITHKELAKKNGRDGNFGLDDQLNAIKWVKNNIESFYGDSNNITLMGQSAGAISIQYLCLNHKNENLFQRAIMMSGAGQFPSFGAPRKPECSHAYWEEFMKELNADSIEELKTMELERIFNKLDEFTQTHKGNTTNCMPVVDGLLIDKTVNELFKNPINIDYMIGYTNCDMYGPALAYLAHKYSKQTHAYLYYFDVDAKGDNSKAFHSSDLRFVFNTLARSWRPFTKDDYYISELMMTYITNFAYSGNPNLIPPNNAEFVKPDFSLPVWKKAGTKAIHLREQKKIKMTRPHYFKLIHNMISNGGQL